MKKSRNFMLTLTIIFLALIVGVFIGRNSKGTWVTISPSAGSSNATTVSGETPPQTGKVNINTADKNTLMLLPGIGNTKAQKIIEFREKHGRFTSIDDLIDVDGFGYAIIEELRPYITVGG